MLFHYIIKVKNKYVSPTSHIFYDLKIKFHKFQNTYLENG